jgi:hypothetical protein
LKQPDLKFNSISTNKRRIKMEAVRIVLRLVHISSGTFWVGAAIFITLFLNPTVRAAGAEGGRFMQRLITQTPVVKYMNYSSLLAVVSGILLYGLNVGFSAEWVASREGMIFTLGSLAGLVAYGTGHFLIAPTAQRMGVLGSEIAMAGGPPSELQLAEMSSLQARALWSGQLGLVMMVITVAGMAGARIF